MIVALAHFVEDAGLLVGLGSIVVRRLGRIPRRPDWVDPPISNALLVAVAGGGGVLLLDHSWLVALRVGVEVVAWIVCTRGIPALAPLVVLAALLLAPAGHAARVEPPAGAELVDGLHVLSAGMWGGGIFALASLRPPEGWRSPEARALLDRFGRVATIAFAVTALTGLLRATEQLRSLPELWATAYGITLSIKVAGVLVMLVLALLWRRGQNVGKVDALVMVAVVLATGLLAVFPSPA